MDHQAACFSRVPSSRILVPDAYWARPIKQSDGRLTVVEVSTVFGYGTMTAAPVRRPARRSLRASFARSRA
ncbi:hypothetical protein ELH74_32185 (plasmid) [Rhizobium ruizarguesonis]|nr:hypothetical protein ELH74_32185 [Rhizobium ruizarguesonis]